MSLPRLLLAGLGGDSGKTLVAAGLARCLSGRGFAPAAFKKGPDFIDAAWLGLAAGCPGRNLDTFIMDEDAVLWSLRRSAGFHDIAVIEGNRGLYDGFDFRGTHSSAALARLTRTPVVLVVDCTKATRTISALVLGCQLLEPDVNLAGVILNKVGTARQERVISKALRSDTGLPVLGVVPRMKTIMPARHLGLVTAAEHPEARQVLERLGQLARDHLDIDALLEIADGAEELPSVDYGFPRGSRRRIRAGVLRHPAFSFYYPENLEALEAAGAELVDVDPSAMSELPAIDLLLAGGGFPESHAGELAANRPFMDRLLRAIEGGLPVWAECGGLMYFSRWIEERGARRKMVGALPFGVVREGKPQGHGYVEARIEEENPFLPVGTVVRGHEFHYSRVADETSGSCVMRLSRGVGLGNGRDGVLTGRLFACYTHLHALGVPGWAACLVDAASGGRDRWV
ncbi:MAG: cobyrinate a,c-diamide synthase [Deltaproteobacteria bacterium]|nr:MAG: cobyrinate a,c-diamide synthase [Deltaproteobacteria bacterium]